MGGHLLNGRRPSSDHSSCVLVCPLEMPMVTELSASFDLLRKKWKPSRNQVVFDVSRRVGITVLCQAISGKLKARAPLGYEDIDDRVPIAVWRDGQMPRKLNKYSLLDFQL